MQSPGPANIRLHAGRLNAWGGCNQLATRLDRVRESRAVDLRLADRRSAMLTPSFRGTDRGPRGSCLTRGESCDSRNVLATGWEPRKIGLTAPGPRAALAAGKPRKSGRRCRCRNRLEDET